MKTVASGLLLCLAFIGAFVCPGALAEEYPVRPIQFIIPFDPGTASDQVGRFIVSLAEKESSLKFVITNRPGGAGAVGYTVIRSTRPDGYTIGLGTSTLASHKVYNNIDFDHNDVETVLIFHSEPFILCVPAKSAYKTLKDFVDDAKERPDALTIATGAPGGMIYVATTDFLSQAGIRVRIIPSSGGGAQPAIQAGGGHVDASLTSIMEAQAQIDAGNLRALALYANERVERLPDVPSLAELGYSTPIKGIRGIIAPSGTPREYLRVIHDAFKKAMDTPEYRSFVTGNSGIVLYGGFEDARKLLDVEQQAFRNAAAK